MKNITKKINSKILSCFFVALFAFALVPFFSVHAFVEGDYYIDTSGDCAGVGEKVYIINGFGQCPLISLWATENEITYVGTNCLNAGGSGWYSPFLGCIGNIQNISNQSSEMIWSESDIAPFYTMLYNSFMFVVSALGIIAGTVFLIAMFKRSIA